MKAFTAGLGTESNTFSPLYIGLQDFRDTYYFGPGEHPPRLTEVSAPLIVLRERRDRLGWRVVEGSYAFALPGGRVGKVAYETLRDEILAQLRGALPVDIVALSLHGAMAAVGCDDCEGDLLRRARQIVGPTVPIGAELDPHANLSAAMVDAADVLIAMKEYPHTDFLERGEELIDLLGRVARGTATPVKAVHDCRMIGRFHTFRQPMRGFVDRLQIMERTTPKVLSISLIHGFPWADVSDMGAKVLVITDADPALAQDIAADIGHEVERIREDCYTRSVPIERALAEAMRCEPGPVILADVADNPGGGAAGDSTVLLRAVLATGARACVGPLWDPMAVRIASAAGVGAEIRLRIGGKSGEASGVPLDATGIVTAFSPAAWQSWAGTRTSLGAACAFRVGNAHIVLVSAREQAYSPDLFTNLGVDPASLRLVVVKSAQHFVNGFQALTRRIVLVGGGGPLETDFRRIDYRHITRPKWPLDDDTPG